MNNRTIIFLSTILAVIVIIFHFSAKKQPTDDETNMFDYFKRPLQWKGKLAPDFEIGLLGGGNFSLSDNIGKKAVILNFFATWCGPCKSEMPELNRFYEKHKEEPFVFIGINGDEREDKVQEFIQEHRVQFPVGIDKEGKIQKIFGARAYPTTIFIGADGIVHIYEVGPIMNADIAFDAFYNASMEMIKAGTGIARDAFLHRQKEQIQSSPTATENKEQWGDIPKKDESNLIGRAKAIAEKMDCPCGCTHKVIECDCKTAKDIKGRLKKTDLTGMTDAEAIKMLNKEFCVKNDKS